MNQSNITKKKLKSGNLTPDELEKVKMAKDIYNSNLGENIFLLRKERVIKKILNDKIIDVKLSKELPNILNIEIKENTAIAFITTESGKYVNIDILGRLKGEEQEQKPDLPEIIGINIDKIKNGGSIFDDNNINIIFNAFNDNNINILKFDFSNENDIKLNSIDFEILIGNIKHLEDKIKYINNLIYDISINNTNISKIDLRIMEIPIIIKD